MTHSWAWMSQPTHVHWRFPGSQGKGFLIQCTSDISFCPLAGRTTVNLSVYCGSWSGLASRLPCGFSSSDHRLHTEWVQAHLSLCSHHYQSSTLAIWGCSTDYHLFPHLVNLLLIIVVSEEKVTKDFVPQGVTCTSCCPQQVLLKHNFTRHFRTTFLFLTHDYRTTILFPWHPQLVVCEPDPLVPPGCCQLKKLLRAQKYLPKVPWRR